MVVDDLAGVVLVRRAYLPRFSGRNLDRCVFHHRSSQLSDVREQHSRHGHDHIAGVDTIIYLDG